MKNLEAITGKRSTNSLQKTAAVPRTSHIYCCLKIETWAVRITVGSRGVPGRKGLRQET